jgi:hypothetical protein
MESVIAYTDRLWKSLERPPRPQRRPPRADIVGRLAPWSATLTRADSRQYAIAVAEHSGLSLVFEVTSVDAFKPAMVAALRAVFEDLGIPSTALPEEIADVESAAFVRLRDAIVREELEFIEAMCGDDLHSFVGVERRVQLDLNDFPRQRQTPFEPRLAAPLLFGVPSATVH